MAVRYGQKVNLLMFRNNNFGSCISLFLFVSFSVSPALSLAAPSSRTASSQLAASTCDQCGPQYEKCDDENWPYPKCFNEYVDCLNAAHCPSPSAPTNPDTCSCVGSDLLSCSAQPGCTWDSGIGECMGMTAGAGCS
jgi:hypothetical protein